MPAKKKVTRKRKKKKVTGLDIPALHRYLWERSDSKNTIVVNQMQMAHDLGVAHDCVFYTMRAMTKMELVRVLKKVEMNKSCYVVTRPENAGPKVSERKAVAWG